jgi:hypothetical protein
MHRSSDYIQEECSDALDHGTKVQASSLRVRSLHFVIYIVVCTGHPGLGHQLRIGVVYTATMY